VQLDQGAEMGRFNMGSTVILLFSPQKVRWEREMQRDAIVRMGEPLAKLTG